MPDRERRPEGAWSDGAILAESERWVHVPRAGTRLLDPERLAVLLPARHGASRVWRSWPDRGRAETVVFKTVEETRAAGGTRLVWHTGDAVSPPFMDEVLVGHGFEKTEDLDVLAFELGPNREPKLSDLRVPANVRAWPVEDEADLLRAHAIETAIFPASTPKEPDVRAYFSGLAALKRPGSDDGLPVPRALRYLAAVRGPGDEVRKEVATAGAELAGMTVRLWGAGTLPEHRGRGAYRALVIERCRSGHALGATLPLSKASTRSSAPLLRKAGFRTVAAERRYVLDLPHTRTPAGL